MNFKRLREHALFKKIIIAVIIIGIIGLGQLGGWWDELLRQIQPGRTPKPKIYQQTPSLVTTKTRLTGWKDRQKLWEIEADRIWQNDSGNQVFFENIHHGIVFSVKDKRVDFSAGSARWERYQSLLYIEDGLDAQTDQGAFSTSRATMNYKSQEMVCPEGVLYTEKDTQLIAKSLRIDFANEDFYLTGDVVLSQKDALIKAGGMVYNYNNKQYLLTNPEGITVFPSGAGEPVTITGRDIRGDYDKKLTFIDGDIRIVQGKTVITTDKAEINIDKKTAIFTRLVKLSHPDVTITAERLDYDMNKKTGTFKRQVTLDRIEAKDDGGKTNRDPFTLTADQLYFESDTKNFSASGQTRIKHRDFTGGADTTEYQDQQQKMIFKGAVEVVQDSDQGSETTIRGKTVELDLTRKALIIPEQAESSEPDVNITGGELDYNYDRKIGTFKKQVVLNRLEVKGSNQKTKKDPFKLNANELSFDSDTNNFVARGNGTLEHKEFNGTADLIEYDDAAQTLIFEGNAILKRPKGESIKGEWIRINLDEETFTVRNKAVTELQVDQN
jgi:lipopolysaccharide export system protein LptA